MNKKFLIRLAPLLVIAAFAVVPAAAQAFTHNGESVHWQLNSEKTAVGVRTPVIGWGELSLESLAGTITCQNAAASNNTNVEIGGKVVAKAEVVMFSTYECKPTGGECVAPAEIRATALNLLPDEAGPGPKTWNSETYEEGAVGSKKFRAEAEAEPANQIEVGIECYLSGEKIGSITFVTGTVAGNPTKGTSEPKWQNNGPNAEKPGETIFDTLSGHLQAESETEAPVEEEVGEMFTTAGSTEIKNAAGEWGPIVKAHTPPVGAGSKCFIKSSVTFPNDFLKEINGGTPATSSTAILGNEVNPTKPFAFATGKFPYKVNCGKHIALAIEGSTRGKVKVSQYGPSPVGLISMANAKAAPPG